MQLGTPAAQTTKPCSAISSAATSANPGFRSIPKSVALVMTAHRSYEIVPACGFVAKVALLQPCAFSAGHFPHHSEAALHKMTGGRGMALSALPSRGCRVNVIRDEPGLSRVAECAIRAEISLMYVLHLVA